MKIIRLLIILLVLQTAFFSVANGKTETIKGTVIAHQPFAQLLCVWHPCAVFLIVKVEDKKQSKYLRIDVEYFPTLGLPNNGFPTELTKILRKWKFKVIRDETRDEPLKKYLNVVDDSDRDISNEAALAAWQLLSGAENEKLPFGETLPNYRVNSNKFKPVN
jgi:hypothetical protein